MQACSITDFGYMKFQDLSDIECIFCSSTTGVGLDEDSEANKMYSFFGYKEERPAVQLEMRCKACEEWWLMTFTHIGNHR